MNDIRLPVPYFAQWESAHLVPEFVNGTLRAEDDPAWAAWGSETPDEYAFWAGRTCGVACLRMVLAYRDGSAPAPALITRECVEAGAYVIEDDGVRGLIYAPFAEYVRARWNLAAIVHPQMTLPEVTATVVSGRPVMISVHGSIRYPAGQPAGKGGHLVLVVGYVDDHFLVHNPSGLPGISQEFFRISADDLEGYFAGRGVVLAP